MEKIETTLTRMAQKAFPGAIVKYSEDEIEIHYDWDFGNPMEIKYQANYNTFRQYELEYNENETLILGFNFEQAKDVLEKFIKKEKSKNKKKVRK